MKFQVRTELLKDMVAKAIKGASCNKLIPITSMIGIELKDNKLILHTTDMTNHLYISRQQLDDNFTGEDVAVTVAVDTFSKLIGRMTCENVKFELKDNSLEIKGNGTYNLELPLDENGTPVVFPNPLLQFNADGEPVDVTLSDIKAVINTAKSSLATTMEIPCLTGYYIGDKTLTTDKCKICCIDKCIIDGEPVLISAEMMDLLDLIDTDSIKVYRSANTILFSSAGCDIYGYVMEDIDSYPVDAIKGLLTTPFNSVCKVKKDSLLATLDRIALFVGEYENNAVRLNFTTEGIDISSVKSDGIENVSYTESENFKPFTCLMNINMLITQLKAYTGDIVELHYGDDRFVSFVNDDITQITALLEQA